MSQPSTNRLEQLSTIPEEFRDLVGERLREWDQLDPATQNEIRDNEATLRYFTEIEGASDEQKARLLENLTPARRQELEKGIADWRGLPEEDRLKAQHHFTRFFGLNDKEKEQALRTLSEPERRKIEKTLVSFARLSPAERVQCMVALEKFAGLSLAERQQFLKSAERWRQMPPDERDAWTRLVTKLAAHPPLPPGLNSPPRPPVPRPLFPRPAVATNGN